MTALALDRVSVTLGGARIVDRVSAEVAEGEWVALIGPNGAGKTTLLRAVTGFVPYEGSIAVFADDAGAAGDPERDPSRSDCPGNVLGPPS